MRLISVICLVVVATTVSGLQIDSRRIDVINEWIDRIRSAPKGHSMSPSWTSKSLRGIKPLGVASLPLQNERVDTFPLRFGGGGNSSNRNVGFNNHHNTFRGT